MYQLTDVPGQYAHRPEVQTENTNRYDANGNIIAESQGGFEEGGTITYHQGGKCEQQAKLAPAPYGQLKGSIFTEKVLSYY